MYKEHKQSMYHSDEPGDFPVSFIPHKSGTYFIEIDDEIRNVRQFATAIQVLDQAKEDDQVQIRLQTPGGCVDAGDAFIHAMIKCEAPIHIIATGGVHSMGTHILLGADSFELSDGFNALLHCGQGGAYGAVNEYVAKSTFDMQFRTRKFRESYEGFLSETEIDSMLKGQDIWLDGQMWCDRAEQRINYFQNKSRKEDTPVDEIVKNTKAVSKRK